MDPITNFTILESPNRKALLAEALEIVRYADTHLGSGTPRHSKDKEIQQLATEQLSKLQKEYISFSPRLDVRHLTKADFDELGVPLSREIQAQMRHNRFYQVSVPITLFPKSGWAFSRLECWLEFCPDESNSHNRAIIHEMFPDDVWSEILSFQDHLELGLDENLGFRTVVDEVKGQWKQLSGAAQAKVAVQLGGGARLVVGPFSYSVRRTDVRARGRGNVECFWRLDGKKHVDEEDVRLEVVLMVPKTRKLPLNVTGQVRARHDFQALSADVFKDWVGFFGEAITALFNRGLPVSVAMDWEDITYPIG